MRVGRPGAPRVPASNDLFMRWMVWQILANTEKLSDGLKARKKKARQFRKHIARVASRKFDM